MTPARDQPADSVPQPEPILEQKAAAGMKVDPGRKGRLSAALQKEMGIVDSTIILNRDGTYSKLSMTNNGPTPYLYYRTCATPQYTLVKDGFGLLKQGHSATIHFARPMGPDKKKAAPWIEFLRKDAESAEDPFRSANDDDVITVNLEVIYK